MKQSQMSGAIILMALLTTIAILLVMSYSLDKIPSPATAIGENTIEASSTRKPTTEPTLTAPPPDTPTAEERPILTTTVTKTPSATLATCEIRWDWPVYRVVQGDTLSQIALRANTTTTTILMTNCLQSSTIHPGQTLHLPRAPVTVTPVVTLSPTSAVISDQGIRPTQSPSDGLCLDVHSTITNPQVGAILSGNQLFYGTAAGEDFAFYKLEIRKEDESSNVDFVTFFTSYQPVIDGLLGNLLTDAFSNGEYWIRLVVVDTHYNYLERCSILYTIQN